MGGVPREVTPVIAPGIDVTQFLLLNRESVQGTVTALAISGYTPAETIVPAGELWHVHVASVTCATLPPGDSISFTVGYTAPSGPQTISDVVTATTGRIAAYQRDFWVPSGAGVGVRIMNIVTAAGITVNVNCIITRLRI